MHEPILAKMFHVKHFEGLAGTGKGWYPIYMKSTKSIVKNTGGELGERAISPRSGAKDWSADQSGAKQDILISKANQNVSRETFLVLEKYVALLQKWNRAINLVGKSTESEIWNRHIDDSLQLLPLIGQVNTLADFGSGAGLPGVVIAVARPEIQVTLVEQDQRKAAFLQECIAQLSLKNTRVANVDITSISGRFDMITARALASLPELFSMAYPRLGQGASCLFPKGKNFAIEIEDAKRGWQFSATLKTSATQDEASIILVTELFPNNAK